MIKKMSENDRYTLITTFISANKKTNPHHEILPYVSTYHLSYKPAFLVSKKSLKNKSIDELYKLRDYYFARGKMLDDRVNDCKSIIFNKKLKNIFKNLSKVNYLAAVKVSEVLVEKGEVKNKGTNQHITKLLLKLAENEEEI